MPDTYITLDSLKTTLSLDGETFADADLDTGILAASRAIDRVCKRRFYLDADATQVRYYTPTSPSLVRIDDLVTVTEIASDLSQGAFDTLWTPNTDCVLQPLNAPTDGWPYTRIRAINRMFPLRIRSVRITGRFGWVDIPEEIVAATGMLATRLMRRVREAPFGVIGFAMESGSSAAMIARQDPDVMMLIKPYIRQLVA